MRAQWHILLRVLLNVLVLMSVAWMQWWFTALLALVLAMRFRAYEVVAWGVVLDALYAAPVPLFAELPIFFTLVFTALFAIAEYSKRFLVFY